MKDCNNGFAPPIDPMFVLSSIPACWLEIIVFNFIPFSFRSDFFIKDGVLKKQEIKSQWSKKLIKRNHNSGIMASKSKTSVYIHTHTHTHTERERGKQYKFITFETTLLYIMARNSMIILECKCYVLSLICLPLWEVFDHLSKVVISNLINLYCHNSNCSCYYKGITSSFRWTLTITFHCHKTDGL